MLAINDLSINIAGKLLIKSLTLTIQRGECWGLLGQNGVGKSSLLRTLVRLKREESGKIYIDNEKLSTIKRLSLAQSISLLFQESSDDFWGSVMDYVLMGRYAYRTMQGKWGNNNQDSDMLLPLLSKLDLEKRRDQAFYTLSGGERQRARIAQILMQDPIYYLLDEPLQHLDLRHQAQVMHLFRELVIKQKKAVVIALHDPLWALEFCDYVILLYPNGMTRHGKTSELLTPANLETLYQCDLKAIPGLYSALRLSHHRNNHHSYDSQIH